MVGPSKILTVSYGTFSCTLEGFDDPFATMRGIAEYFRDLAADDRYFGAEPPTPDAEMLHKIAEKEVKRRVEARVSEDGVVLRQVEDRSKDEDATPEADAEPDDTDRDEPSENMFADLADADDEAARTDAAFGEYISDIPPAPARQFDDPNSVAAKLSRIRAVVSSGAAPAGSAFSGPIHDAFADVVDAEPADPADELAQIANANEPDEPMAMDDDLGRDAEAEADMWADPADALYGDDVPEEVAEAEEESAATDDEVVEETAETPAHDDMPAEEVVAAEQDDTEPATPDAEDEEPAAEEVSEEEPVAEELEDNAPVAEDDAPHADEAAPDLPPAAEDDEPVEEMALAARIVRLKRAAMGQMSRPLDARPEAQKPVSDADDDNIFADEAPETAPTSDDTDEAVRLDSATEESDDDFAIDFDLDDSFDDVLEVADDTAGDDATPDTAVEKADVAEEDDPLGALIAEAAHSANSRDDEEDPADTRAAEARKAGIVEGGGSGEASVDRILEQTNSRLEDVEGNRRRSAIAHLKAAVAATKADRLLKRREQPEQEQSQYRDDLAQVVRPRPAEEPKAERASPLVLVSEQRVGNGIPDDEADDQSDDDLRAGIEALEDDDEADANFAEFAERMGASELPDLLEAAAAYTAFVEGQPEFSRPQLMRRVSNLDPANEISREASLRSFGQLLRQGKIQKLKRGQFTIAEESRFNPRARIAGE